MLPERVSRARRGTVSITSTRFVKQGKMTPQMDHAYRVTREALLDCLHDGHIDAAGLRAMQSAMTNMLPNKAAFGAARYDELRGLLDEVETLPVREPMPPPTFRNTWPLWLWLVVTAVAYYYAGKLILLIAAFVFLVRGVLWCSRRFPLTTYFFVVLIGTLLGGRGRGRRW